ncbi:hypothetical protein ACKKBG_A28165 [Auxenochlorella protothecoides x Auxenochlorella symbiontica]
MSVAPKAIEGDQSMVADVRVRYDITVDIEGEVDWVDDPANAWEGVVDPQPWVRPRWADDATCVISPGSKAPPSRPSHPGPSPAAFRLSRNRAASRRIQRALMTPIIAMNRR